MKTYLLSLFFFFFALPLSRAQSAADIWSDTLRANALFKQADVLRDSGIMDKATLLYLECATIWQHLIPDGSVREARAIYLAGFCQYRFGKYADSEVILQRALTMQRRILPTNDMQIGNTLNMLALADMERGNYQGAANLHREVLAIYTLHYGRKSLKTAKVLSDLGASLGYLGYFRENLAIQEEVLTIIQQLVPAKSRELTRPYMALGTAYKQARRYREALAYFQQALDIYTHHKHEMTAAAYFEIGLVYLAQKEPQKALEFIEKGRDLMVDIGEEAHATFGYPCIYLGRAHYELGHFATAVDWEQKAIRLFLGSDGPDNPMLEPLYHHLGLAQAANGQFEQAMASLAESSRILRLIEPNPENHHRVASDLADVYALWYDQTRADSLLYKSRSFYDKACKFLEQKFKKQSNAILRKKHLYDAVPVVERAIAAEYKWLQKFPNDREALEKAWRWSEYLHGFLLNSTIQEAEAKKIAGIPDALLEQETQLRLRLTEMEKFGTRLVQDKGLSLTHPEVVNHHTQQLETEAAYEALVQGFAQRYPDYYRLKHDLTPTSLRDIQRLLKPGQTILEYFTGDKNIFAFVVRPDTALLIRISHDFPLALWVTQFREGILGYHTAYVKKPAEYERTVRQYARTAHDLYQKLLAPVARWLTPDLLIVPDAALNYLPFEALISAVPTDLSNFKTYPFVVLERNISYTYSATLQHQLSNRAKKAPASDHFLGFAPFFNADTVALSLRLDQELSMRAGLQPLPYSGEEVLRAGKRIKGPKTIITGKDATRKQFLALAGQYRILHLATHAKANEKTGEWSHIAFAHTADDSTGLLYAGDIYNLCLNADLVVLSACETGTGELQYGEGVISLARAFYYAGARSVATSLWKVNDQSTMRVTDQFYAEWAKKKSKHAALTDAKRYYLQKYSGASAHPFFWAGLVLTGE
jgi:CHAT domain-containing protein/tetratricopeptide (TPR) repeat protein